MKTLDNPAWVEKYRPGRVEDVVLPSRLKDQFQAMVRSGKLPNLILSGPPGIGKTTIALAMLEEMGHDVYLVNGSLNGNIDTLRTEILDFASSVSFTGARKTVLIDEADYLTTATQPALRNFMEEYSHLTGWILTCNYKSRIIEPLHSRCSVIDFSITKEEKVDMLKTFFLRVSDILEKEGVQYDKRVVGEVIARHFPDWRRCLNELQRYSIHGPIDTGVLSRRETNFKTLLEHMKSKNFTEVRKWLGEAEVDPPSFFRSFYDHASENFSPDSVPNLILLIADYQYKASHVMDQEVNLAAFLAHVMSSCQFK